MNICETLQQLTLSNNPIGRLRTMIGADSFTKEGEESSWVAFKFKAKAKNKANYIKITLNPMDTYDLEFCNIRGMKVNWLEPITNVYCDQLKEVFEIETGLYLSL
jgi:hypothetical protein